MVTEKLTVELPEDLYHKLIGTVTTKGGIWRNQESCTEALESAVAMALKLFLKNLTGGTELPEFREYARLKYPELGGDLITMMADLIERQKEIADKDLTAMSETLIERQNEIAPCLRPRTIHSERRRVQ